MAEPIKKRGWFFDGTNDFLEMQGTDPDAIDFSPSQNSDDFTVIAWVIPFDVTRSTGIFGRWNTDDGNHRMWMLYIGASIPPEYRLIVSADGTTFSYAKVVAVDGKLAFLCGRYQYVTDGTSVLKIMVDDVEDVISNAVGPIYHNTITDLMIGNWQAGATKKHWGKKLGIAWFNRVLTDPEVASVKTGDVEPKDLPGFVMQAGFDDLSVGAAYTPEYGGPYTFDVVGAPEPSGALFQALALNLDIEDPVPAVPNDSPEVSSVQILSETSLRVNFVRAAVDNAALRNPVNYVTSPDLAVSAVVPESVTNPTYVILTHNEQTTGVNYTVTLTKIQAA